MSIKVVEGKDIKRDYHVGGGLFRGARTVHAVKGVSFSVDKGKTISTTIVGAFRQLKAAIGSALTQSKSLSTTSPRAFKDGANHLGRTVRSSLSAISASLGKLQSTDLEKAAAKEPACTALSGA
jgi:ABC-type microcin C transport system duplicated ATPase subunit YejF